MSFLTLSLSSTLIAIAFLHYLRQYFLSPRNKKLPPGPIPLPIIGNIHLLGNQPHRSLSELAKRHGPIMCLKLGRVTAIVISSPAIAKEVLQKQDLAFSSRDIPDGARAHDHHKYSVTALPVAPRWRTMRRIMNFNIFSASRLSANQELRSKKVQQLVAYCKKKSETGEAVNLGQAAFRTSLNSLSNTVFSRDFADPFSDSAQDLKALFEDIMIEAGKPNLSDYFPIIRKADVQGIYSRMTGYFGKVLKLFGDLIDERLEKYRNSNGGGGLCNDVLDELLALSKQSPEEIERVQIEHFFLDFFLAGTDTTSNTVEWAMAELLKKPNILKKAKDEIERIFGKGKVIDESDITCLPYLQCVVKETLRLHPAVPLLLPRKVGQEDLKVFEYTVPKNSLVLVNAWAIGRDESVWENPDEFNPDRFLDSDLDVKGRDFELIPFGAGRRICPGMPLAVRIIPAMVGSLLNCFDWKIEGGIEPEALDMDDEFGIAVHKAHPLMAVPCTL